MQGTVLKTFERTSGKTGKKYWNVMVQEGESVNSYLTSVESLSKEGTNIEFIADPPKKAGDMPWIRTASASASVQRGRPQSGNVKAFACSYAKDVVVAKINHSVRGGDEISESEIIGMLEVYYNWFIDKMQEKGE